MDLLPFPSDTAKPAGRGAAGGAPAETDALTATLFATLFGREAAAEQAGTTGEAQGRGSPPLQLAEAPVLADGEASGLGGLAGEPAAASPAPVLAQASLAASIPNADALTPTGTPSAPASTPVRPPLTGDGRGGVHDGLAAAVPSAATGNALPTQAGERAGPVAGSGTITVPASPAGPAALLGKAAGPSTAPREGTAPAPASLRAGLTPPAAAEAGSPAAEPPTMRQVARAQPATTVETGALPALPAAPTQPAQPAGTSVSAQLSLSAAEPARQVADAVKVRTGEQSITVRLDPPELGRVRIDFVFERNVVTAVVSAEHAGTDALLRRHGDWLQQALADAGLEGAGIDWAGSDDRHDEGPWSDVFLREAPLTVSADRAPGVAVPRAGPASGLDLRL